MTTPARHARPALSFDLASPVESLWSGSLGLHDFLGHQRQKVDDDDALLLVIQTVLSWHGDTGYAAQSLSSVIFHLTSDKSFQGCMKACPPRCMPPTFKLVWDTCVRERREEGGRGSLHLTPASIYKSMDNSPPPPPPSLSGFPFCSHSHPWLYLQDCHSVLR